MAKPSDIIGQQNLDHDVSVQAAYFIDRVTTFHELRGTTHQCNLKGMVKIFYKEKEIAIINASRNGTSDMPTARGVFKHAMNEWCDKVAEFLKMNYLVAGSTKLSGDGRYLSGSVTFQSYNTNAVRHIDIPVESVQSVIEAEVQARERLDRTIARVRQLEAFG